MATWVKLYRKLEDSSFYLDSRIVHLWVHILIKARAFEEKTIFGGNEITLNPGQFVTGRKKLSRETGIEESKIQRSLKVFEKCLMIEQQTNSQSRLITVLNWDTYQGSEQQMNNKRTANEQQMNTIKESKKEERKNKNNTSKPENINKGKTEAPNVTDFEITENLQKWSIEKGVSPDQLEKYIEECLIWHGAKGNRYKNWSKTIQNWILKDLRNKPEIKDKSNKISFEKYKEAFQWLKDNPCQKFKNNDLNKIKVDYPYILEYDIESKKFELTYKDYLKI